MTNATIILNESVKLMNDGILAGTGEFVTMEYDDGTKEQVEIPEPIHTFQAWKSLGYSVKKGEKAVAKFPIWKHTSKTIVDEETKEESEKTSMFMKMSAFFKASQVEKIEGAKVCWKLYLSQ